MVLVHNQQRRVKVDKQWLANVVEVMQAHLGCANFAVAVILTNNAKIRELNRFYRGKDAATDIISVPFYPKLRPGQLPKPKKNDALDLGDLFISMEFVVQELKRLEVELMPHLVHLLAHGLCHLLGYTHDTPARHAKLTVLESQLIQLVNTK